MMKVILVPTDFTVTAANAVMYGAELALAYKAKLVLVNVCTVSGVTPILWERSPAEKDIEADAKLGMDSLMKRIRDRFMGTVRVESHVVWGNPETEIRNFIGKTAADLLVIGVRESNFLTSNKMWDGSSVQSIYRNAGCPVLAVKQKSNFRSIRKLLLAYDGEVTLNDETKKLIQAFSDRFHVKLKVMMVTPEDNRVDEIVIANLKNQLSTIVPEGQYEFEITSGNDVFGEIQQKGKEWSADLLIMLPHEHDALTNARQNSQSEKMVLDGHIPVLTMYN